MRGRSLSTTERPRGRRLRRVLGVLAVAVVLVILAGVITARTPAPVGHWRNSEGLEAFRVTYAAAMAELPTPDEVTDVRTDFGVVRAYRFAGSGEAGTPLLLLPGRGSATPMWAANVPHLLPFGDVYAVDLLGEPGASVQERPIESRTDQARWLHQALSGLDEDAFHFVGVSIGGWTAVNYATQHPDLVASLTLLDPPFTFSDIDPEWILRALPTIVPWAPKSWRDDFNSWVSGEPADDLPVGRMLESGQQHYVMRLPAPERIPEAEIRELTMPVLAIFGEESVMHDATAAARFAEEALPAGTVRVYEGASHAVGGQQPERVADDLGDLLDAGR